ncbi:histidine kinase [Lecanosticta acicola]|uniref:histidine kinase n=1 Tax=Lecanosticta acicola TaxID=111012 RepID=A0AAI9EAR0_9PEZI|nr:histidine kinase [Lecanosticta acicola]
MAAEEGDKETPGMMERQTICFPNYETADVLKRGDAAFTHEIRRLYDVAESNALEQLIELKRSLRQLPTEDFWGAVTEGMSRILGAEICFVMKRVLVDDQESAVEMPPIGEPGSCLMAAALHYCASDGNRETSKSTKFHAYGCPCAYMRHDKVFLVPERLGDFFNNNPNKLPTPCEAYIAVPLFEEGKCFAHFGAMWSTEGAARRRLSWAFIEMVLHSLEDMISNRFLQGADFIKPSTVPAEKNRVIPHDAVTVAQSLRPYAGSLSHELRTPMQGVVGMLDVMYATVLEAIDTQADPRVRQLFENLKENIETVQDSSRRAVEAADNVVHAYDMDMSVPDAPPALLDEPSDSLSPLTASADRRPEILVAGSNLPMSRPNKRRRDEAFSRDSSDMGAAKAPRLSRTTKPCICSEQEIKQGVQQAEKLQAQSQVGATLANVPSSEDAELAASAVHGSGRIIAPGLRHTSLRELLQLVINEGLKVGGRPDSAIAQETDAGEIIEVRTRGSDGTVGQKMIEWSIDSSVPTTMFIDEKDLSKLISCVFLNAIKFTDKTEGHVRVYARMSNRGRYISIKISDNGPGIPAAFLPKLFKPFSQENNTTTRSSEGLGLGLMVAKGIARKLGGDLMCTRAETHGAQHGTEFDIKVPLHAGEAISRPISPFASPAPRRAHLNTEAVHIQPLAAAPGSPRKLTRALHEAVNQGPFFVTPATILPATPLSPKSAGSDVQSPPSSSLPSPPNEILKPKPRMRKSVANPEIDRDLARKCPLNFLVVEDNKINRRLLVNMLGKFGYKQIHEAHDGTEAVRQMAIPRPPHEQIDVVLMDLWMPLMDGYEATERILQMDGKENKSPTVLAVTADVTDGALERAAEVGMRGFMTKPYMLLDLQRLITEYCASHSAMECR